MVMKLNKRNSSAERLTTYFLMMMGLVSLGHFHPAAHQNQLRPSLVRSDIT